MTIRRMAPIMTTINNTVIDRPHLVRPVCLSWDSAVARLSMSPCVYRVPSRKKREAWLEWRQSDVVFSSIVFLWLFMPLVLAVYVLMPPRARNTVLALLSLLFYAWGARSIIFVFLASIFVNYLAGRAIGQLHGQRKDLAARRVMWAAIVFDLAVLFVWKYADFAVSQVDDSFTWRVRHTRFRCCRLPYRSESRSSLFTRSATSWTSPVDRLSRCVTWRTTRNIWRSFRSL